MKPPTAFELELRAQQVAELLHSSRSVTEKRQIFFQFFQPILDDAAPERWLSYCRQFFPFLPSLLTGIETCHWDPADLVQLLGITLRFRQFCPDQESQCRQFEDRIRAACILQFLVVGESDRAGEVLGAQLPTTIQRLSAEESTDILLKAAPADDLREELRAAIASVRANIGVFRANMITVLLVSGDQADTAGVMLPFYVHVRERPKDAEDDRVLLNNITSIQYSSLLSSLMDAITAARVCLPPDAQSAHYFLQFSIVEKEAELVGTSLGFAAALLALTGAVNHYYRLPVYALCQNIAVTAAIAPDGHLLPVDEKGLTAKLHAAFFSSIERVFVARANLSAALKIVAELERRYPRRLLPVHGFEHLRQALEDRNLVRSKPLTLPVRLVSQVRRVRRLGVKAAALLTTMVLIYLIAWNPFYIGEDRNPADFDIKGSALIVKNKSDEVLWKYDFGVPLNKPSYLENQAYKPLLRIIDLDGDHKQEIIIGFSDEMHDHLDGRIYCFSPTGRVRWIGKPGRPLTFGDSVYDDRYLISELHVLNDHQGKRWVAAAAHHRPYFPSVVSVYSADGLLQGEYWNAGVIVDMAVHDFDADGDDEILACGYRNEDGRAFLAVLEIDNMRGLAPQDSSGSYFSRDLQPGTERWYLRLPRSPFAMKNPYRDFADDLLCGQNDLSLSLCNGALPINLLKDSGVATLRYDFRFELIDWHISDMHIVRLQQQLGRQMTPAEIANLSRTEYWDGVQWVQTPTESSRYRQAP